MWGFSIQTDYVIEARIPDLVVVDKKRRSCKIIDFPVSGDSRIEEEKEDIKVSRSRKELQRIWSVRVKIIPLVAGSLGATPEQFGTRPKYIGVTAEIEQVQKTNL